MRKHLLSVALGLVGVLLGLVCWHLYVDHQRIDAVWELEVRRAAQSPASAPAPAPGK